MVTEENFPRFKKAYEEAAVMGDDTIFEFEGQEVLVVYAKYLIEYFETRRT